MPLTVGTPYENIPNMRVSRLEPVLPPKGTEGNDQGMVTTHRMCIGSLIVYPQASLITTRFND